MAAPTPKLLGYQEKQVALAHLCGVGAHYIQDKWNVSRSVVTKTVAERSSHWNDPLVEFYRGTDSRDRTRNAVHLFLAYNGQAQELPNADLVERIVHEKVYEAVDENIFAPRNKKLMRETGLENMVNLKAQKPSAPEERLLLTIFGKGADTNERVMGFVNSLVYSKLKQAYHQERKVNLNRVYHEAADEISGKLRYLLSLDLDPRFRQYTSYFERKRIAGIRKDLDYAMRDLTPREDEILRLKFGLGSDSPKTLEEIGGMQGVGDERIRQIEAKALRKLRHPSRSKRLRKHLI